jgi:hypothetical protein
MGIIPKMNAFTVIKLTCSLYERAEGIEPSCVAWKATVLPLNYARISNGAMLSDRSDKCNSELPPAYGAKDPA